MTSGIAPGRWHDAHTYRPVAAGGRGALAWELMRRDAAYREGVVGEPAAGARVVRADAACDMQWGLHFPS